MSSDAIAIQTAEAAGRPWVEMLHEWVTTVDHKRLGVLYILYALFFLVIGGIEATIMRIQLMRPHNDFVSPQDGPGWTCCDPHSRNLFPERRREYC